MHTRVLGLLAMALGVLLVLASTWQRGGIDGEAARFGSHEKRYDLSGIGSMMAPWTSYDSLVVAHGKCPFHLGRAALAHVANSRFRRFAVTMLIIPLYILCDAPGVIMFVAWQILAPVAIMIASMCRTWSRWWLRAHWLIQAALVVPLTIAGIVIGTVMHTVSQKPITKHKVRSLLSEFRKRASSRARAR
jgi:hypothetical protein